LSGSETRFWAFISFAQCKGEFFSPCYNPHHETNCLPYPPGEPWEFPLPGSAVVSTAASSVPLEASSGPLYIGVDIGRLRDLTVIWILEKSGPVLHTRKIICLEKQTFEVQEAVLYPIFALPNMRRCCIDATGLGCQFVERPKKKFNRYRVEGLTFTAALKEKLAYKLRCAFEDKTIRIPDDRILDADIHSIRKTMTAAGNTRFEGERTTNGHADRFWAACAAVEAAATCTDPNRIFAQII
jgi:phage FluMu gp28-like protein